MFLYCNFFLGKIHFLGVFTPFFTCFCKISSQASFLVQNEKLFFFNFIKIVKNVARRIFDKKLRYFYISAFSLDKTYFLDFFSSFLLFSDFLTFFIRGHFEGLQKFRHPKISKMNNQSVFLLLSQIFHEKTYYMPYKFRMQKMSNFMNKFLSFFCNPDYSH